MNQVVNNTSKFISILFFLAFTASLSTCGSRFLKGKQQNIKILGIYTQRLSAVAAVMCKHPASASGGWKRPAHLLSLVLFVQKF